MNIDIRRTELEMDAELCRRSLRHFTKEAWHILEPGRELLWGWPMDAITEHLEAAHRGEITRLLMTVPPGSMKSLSTRVFAPVWRWLHQPRARFIGASYSHSLALRDNRRAKMIVESEWFRDRFKDLTIDPNRSANEDFGNTRTGWMKATSVGGVGTGERGDQFIIDDPHNVSEAESETKRRTALNWFHETVPSRLNDLSKDSIVVIMQRVHQEDVAQAAIELGYEHLLIPMHYDPDRTFYISTGWTDPRTVEGQLMWEERFPRAAVERLEDTLGPYAAAAQLEQSPVPREGGLIEVDEINIIEKLPRDRNFVWARGWDLAGSQGKGAYTVGVLIAFDVDNRDLYIVDVRRKRLNPTGVRQLMNDTAENDAEMFDDSSRVRIVYPKDPGQAGKAQAQDIADELLGFNVRAEQQTGDKETRAEPFASHVGSGKVFCLDRGWTKHYLEELRFFPRGKYKDQVDASASAYNELIRLTRKKKRVTLAIVSESQPNPAKVEIN